MISGKHLVLLLLLISPIPGSAESASSPAESAAVAAVARFARTAPIEEAFVEFRFSRFTKKPVRSSGVLRYRGADDLVREVRQPRPETSILGQGMIRIERPGQKPRQVSLKRVPELEALLASFSGLLGGDASRLEPLFSLDFNEGPEGFTLQLVPRQAAMQKRLSHIDVVGIRDVVGCLVFAEPDREQSIVLIGDKAAVLPSAWTSGDVAADALVSYCRQP